MVEIVRYRPTFREPGLIPMINIVLLLLVFFLVAGSIEKFEALTVELPISKNGRMLSDGQIVVILGQQREIVVNDDFVTAQDFGQTLQELLKDNPRKIISLKADQNLPATFMIAVMNQIKEAGGTNISLITNPF